VWHSKQREGRAIARKYLYIIEPMYKTRGGSLVPVESTGARLPPDLLESLFVPLQQVSIPTMNSHSYTLDSHSFRVNPDSWANEVVVSVRLTPLIFSHRSVFIVVHAAPHPFRVITRLISVPSAALLLIRNRSVALNQEQSDPSVHDGLGRQLRILCTVCSNSWLVLNRVYFSVGSN
jgi:hypothetical protein